MTIPENKEQLQHLVIRYLYGDLSGQEIAQFEAELRVILEPENISENEATCLSRDMVKRIESEMQFPGQIKVCVIRETRAVEYAN